MDLHAGDRPRHRGEDASRQPPAGQLPQLVQAPVCPDGVQPGDVSTTSSRDVAAGSRSMAPSTSSRKRSDRTHLRARPSPAAYGLSCPYAAEPAPPRTRGRASAGSRALDARARPRSSRPCSWDLLEESVDEALEEDGGQVALTERRDDHDDRLALVLRAGRDLDAAAMAAPELMPTSRPSSVAARRRTRQRWPLTSMTSS